MAEFAMRRFVLERRKDVSGVSGTGIVAEGVEFTDGRVSIRWLGERPSTVDWDSLDDAMGIHGHNGSTRVVWLDAKPSNLSDVHTVLHPDGGEVRCYCHIGQTHLYVEPWQADELPTAVHMAPRPGAGLTGCCGRTPFELPPTDRMTNDPDEANCGPLVTVEPKAGR